MKKISIIMAIATVMLFITGCGESSESSSWYPIEGGFINLKQAHRITSSATLAIASSINHSESYLLKETPITKENIEKALNELNKWEKIGTVGCRAEIHIDGFKIVLPSFNSWEESDLQDTKDKIEDILDTWLEAIEDIEDRL